MIDRAEYKRRQAAPGSRSRRARSGATVVPITNRYRRSGAT
jgi:hypothetical protein